MSSNHQEELRLLVPALLWGQPKPAAVPDKEPAPAESMSRASPAAGGTGPRYTYQSLSRATNNFEKRLGSGGCGSVFQGVLGSGTLVAVKKARASRGSRRRSSGAIYDRSNAYRGGGAVASAARQHRGAAGWSKDGISVYALMDGGSLQDRLACRGSGAWCR